jgi:hypothetical protein
MKELTKEEIHRKISELEEQIEEMRSKERALYTMTDEENDLLFLLLNKVHAQIDYDECFHLFSQMKWPVGGEFMAFCKYRRYASLLSLLVSLLDSEIKNTEHNESISNINLTVTREKDKERSNAKRHRNSG